MFSVGILAAAYVQLPLDTVLDYAAKAIQPLPRHDAQAIAHWHPFFDFHQQAETGFQCATIVMDMPVGTLRPRHIRPHSAPLLPRPINPDDMS